MFWVGLIPLVLAQGDWAHPLIIASPIWLLQSITIVLTGQGFIAPYLPYRPELATSTVEHVMAKAAVVNIVGMGVLYGVYLMLQEWRGQLRGIHFHMRRSLFLAAAAIVAITWIANVFIIQRAGSLPEMYVQMMYRSELYEGLGYAARTSLFGTVAALIFLIRGNTVVALAVAAAQILMATAMGNRGNVIFFTVLPMAIVWHYTRKPIAVSRLVALGLVLAVFYQVFGEFRRYGNLERAFDNTEASNELLRTFENIEHPRITASTVHIVDEEEAIQLGLPLFNLFVAPIPRVHWEEKPLVYESGVVGRLLLGDRWYGLPPGTYGYGYLNYGWLGVVLFGAAGGLSVWLFWNTLIGVPSRHGLRIPSGNAVVYAWLVTFVTNPMSTEVQIKALSLAPPLLLIWILCRGRAR